jgi:branched-chain amino acid transport system substrate-binding protein
MDLIHKTLRARTRSHYRRGIALVGVAGLAAAVALVMTSAASAGSRPAAKAASSAPPGGYITNFVKYVDGKPGTANPKLSPAYIGWSSNDSGGTVISIGPEATAAAELTVNWINKYADGIGGHPLVLDKCIVLNSEEEGLACAQKFLNNPKVDVISYGALSVGAATIDSADAGKKPIIMGFSLNPSDVTTKSTYILFGAGGFALYPFGTFAKQYLHAKSCAVIYPNEPGQVENAGSVALACKKYGMSVKSVPFDPTTTDLTGALTAAGANAPNTAVAPLVTTPSNCLSAANAINQLHINPSTVVWYTQCQQPSIKAQYPGGDYPKYYSGISQSGDALTNDPTSKVYAKALTGFGAKADIGDDWYSGMFGQIMTLAQFMNKIGYSKLSPSAMLAQVKAWKGPLLLGGPIIDCGQYKFAPGSCAAGNYFFHYDGNGKWTRTSTWLGPPPALVKELEALPKGASFPTS